VRGAISTGNLGRILAFSPLRLIERAGIIGLHRKEKIMIKRKVKTLETEKVKQKVEEKKKQKLEIEDVGFELMNLNPLAEMEKQRLKEQTKVAQLPKQKLALKEMPNPFDIPNLIPSVRIPSPPLVPLIFPSVSLRGGTKRVHALPSVIKRQFATPEALLEAPLDILSPAGFEKAKEKAKAKKKPTGRRKRIRL
ncbi:MAG: hypothetical protein DRJ64_06320, partial [Thermoprotei archaeon]